MNSVVIYYSHDHSDDTKIVYSINEDGSHLDMYHTHDDPDYGTSHLEWNSEPGESLHDMAKSCLEELSEYLDKTDSGIHRPGDASDELEMVFGEHCNSTLYAIENALGTIVGEPDEMRNRKGTLIRIVSIRQAAKIIKDTLQSCNKGQYDFRIGLNWDGVFNRLSWYANHPYDFQWYGVKRIWNDEDLFDESSYMTDLIIMCGYIGGGNINVAYYTADESVGLKEQDEYRLINALCLTLDAKPDEKIFLEQYEHNNKKEDK